MNGLEQILQHIRSEAGKEAEKTVRNAKADAEKTLAGYTARADAVTAENEKKIAAETAAILARAESQAENIRRDALEDARAALVDEVYEKVRATVCGWSEEEYRALLLRQLFSAVTEQLRVEEETRRLYGDEEDDTLPDTYEVMLNDRDFAAHGQELIAAFRKNAQKVLVPVVGTEAAETALSRLTLANRTVQIDGGLILRVCRREDADRRDGNIEINCSLSTLLQSLRAETEKKVLAALFPAD